MKFKSSLFVYVSLFILVIEIYNCSRKNRKAKNRYRNRHHSRIRNTYCSNYENCSLETCDIDYDYYMFALQYKPGMCHNNHFCSENEVNHNIKWTIHGLWPNKHGGRHDDIVCKDSNLNSFTSNITVSLNLFWPSLIQSSTNFDFHSHEWSKHGSCLKYCYYNILEEHKAQHFYFSKTIELRNMYDPEKFLTASNSTLHLRELQEKFKSNLGITPQLICKKDRTRNIQYLSEIRIPLDLDFKPLELSPHPHDRCNTREIVHMKLD